MIYPVLCCELNAHRAVWKEYHVSIRWCTNVVLRDSTAFIVYIIVEVLRRLSFYFGVQNRVFETSDHNIKKGCILRWLFSWKSYYVSYLYSLATSLDTFVYFVLFPVSFQISIFHALLLEEIKFFFLSFMHDTECEACIVVLVFVFSLIW